METLEINKANALNAYEQANEKGKKLLSNLFGEKVFIKDIRDRIQNFDDVLDVNGTDRTQFYKSCKDLSPDEVAYRQIKEITKAYNQGWKPDWSNSSEYKYYPWFEYAGSGVGFSYGGSDFDHSDSFVGSRLVFKERDHAIDAGNKFQAIYNKFLNN